MPSLQDSALIFILALLLFGPKKLPVLARELGKWVSEFRRASNEFKMQMEEELRVSEQADRQKALATIEATAPAAPLLEGVPTEEPEHPHLPRPEASEAEASEPHPIATSGELSMMPPSTGLPTPQTQTTESIPNVDTSLHEPTVEHEAHG